MRTWLKCFIVFALAALGAFLFLMNDQARVDASRNAGTVETNKDLLKINRDAELDRICRKYHAKDYCDEQAEKRKVEQ